MEVKQNLETCPSLEEMSSSEKSSTASCESPADSSLSHERSVSPDVEEIDLSSSFHKCMHLNEADDDRIKGKRWDDLAGNNISKAPQCQENEVSSPNRVKNLKSFFQKDEPCSKKKVIKIRKVDYSKKFEKPVTVQDKAAMFEKKVEDFRNASNPKQFHKSTWKSASGSTWGQYNKKAWDTRGVAPKKSLADLP